MSASGLPSAFAQQLEEVVVTGSRIATEDGFGQVAPVSVINAEDIQLTGMTRLEDVLNSLPSIETSQNSFISNGATGTASVDLRGLGANRTLVLFNGKRLQPGGVNTQVPDVNQIPAAIVERVEVLTGGASATYGADAVGRRELHHASCQRPRNQPRRQRLPARQQQQVHAEQDGCSQVHLPEG